MPSRTSTSRASAGQRKAVRVTAASLVRLGPDRLAELLSGAAKADTALRRALALEVASGAQELGEEVDRQLDRIRSPGGRLNASRAAKLARQLQRIVDAVADKLAALDASAAVPRLLDVLAVAGVVLPRCTRESAALVEAFASAGARLADVLATTSAADQLRLVEALHTAFAAETLAGVTEALAAQVSPALAAESRGALRALVEADFAAVERRPDRGAASPRGVRLTALLGHLADADGDVDAFLAAQARRPPSLRDPIGSGRRLLAAGRADEALALLDAAPSAAANSLPFAELRIQVLEALGRRDDAQEGRWKLFCTHLSADALRQHLKRLPGFEDVEREEEALARVSGHPDATAALAFLIAWPDPRRAAALVRARQGRFDSQAVERLEHAANVLTPKDPLAATLLLRTLIDAALEDGRRTAVTRAGLLLAECATLAASITDWEGRPEHDVYASRLRFMVRHSRRAGRR